MKRRHLAAAAAILALCATSCEENFGHLSSRVMKLATQQFKLMDSRLPDDKMPKSFDGNENIDSELRWWCSGFFPGSLWQVYSATGDESVRAIAEKQTLKLSGICALKTSHDIGFQVNCSFGNAYRMTGDESWLPVIEAAAEKLSNRFTPETGVIRSWDHSRNKWEYPVIIDNMMNLELEEYASKLFGNTKYDSIAVSHALTTMRNHFRPDFTTFHVVDYDPQTGDVRSRCTHQGYSDDSAWARGQAWALYGYTMMSRETGMPEFLSQAENIADMIIGQLPEDGIPYWDFDAPDIPDALRDASAGAIMASAYVELSTLTADQDKAASYIATAEKQIRTLAGKEYLAKPGENGYFLLKHSVGSLPASSEVDVPLSYADYYFLEAINRFNATAR